MSIDTRSTADAPRGSLRIRDAASADLDSIISIDGVARVDPQRVAFIERSLRDHVCVVADGREGVVGYAVLDYSFFENGFIPLVYVAESARRTGVGMGLITYLESRCSTEKLFTSTNQSNLAMQRLLEKLSFLPSGVIYNLDADDPELVYVKPLRGIVDRSRLPT